MGTANAQCPIIPTPSGYSPINGFFVVPDTLRIHAPEMMPTTFDYLKKELAMRSIILQRAKESADLRVLKVDHGSLFSYEMNIAEKIVITHDSHEGSFYAVNSLLQMIVKKDGKYQIQKCFINDAPRFDWRGLHLDVSRHFFSVDEIKGFIDIMALYKFNKFHWHLTDDQGWRIEIKKYPKLTSIGGFRDKTVIGHFSDEPRTFDTERYGGFYTQEEVEDVVEYAASRFIDVVPEIEMPGHSRAALAAYPEYSCTENHQEVPGLWGIFDDIYCSKEETIKFMQDVLSEVIALFPSEYIHIGGDEAPKTRWKKCKDCKKTIKKNKLKDEHELQSYFIRRMDEYLTERGKKLIGWDEILEGGLSPNAAVMSWRGEAGGIEAAKQGHNVVMSPTTYCYFDYYQSSHDIEPLAIGGYLPLEKVYKYDPIPKELNEEQEKFILGGQANLWTEYMGSMDHVEYMAFPRSLALIQSLWCQKKPNYDRFLQTYLAYHEDYLTLHDVNFSKSIHYPELKIMRAETGIEIQFESIEPSESYSIVRTSSKTTGNMTLTDILSATSKKEHMIQPSEDRIKEQFMLTSNKFDDTLLYKFNLTPDIGREIELVTPPHPKYDHNGSLNLVDGIKGGQKFKGNEWLGFREHAIEMIVDLKNSNAVEGLIIGFKENNGSWIYLPKSLSIYTSNDGVEWTKINSTMEFANGANEISFPMNNSNYIKLIIDSMDEIPEGNGGAGNVPWTFIDEIQFIRSK